ncbi:hypothetical protein ACIPSE_11455 [Streptomyces sp. NPDC090106]|uniref:hypothetical protein n=1 Tax=Streptomyces sp. NPDC090106 TaxID=3365946 RepID=UPI00382D1081
MESLRIDVLNTSVGIRNPRLLGSGAADVGLALGDGSADAYEVTRAMFAARQTLPGPEVPGAHLDERYAIGTAPVPLQPGAVRYRRGVYG